MRATWSGIALLSFTFLAGCHGERDQLARDLKSERPEIRAGAVRRLADLHEDQDLPVFLARSQDFSSMVRKSAAEALGTVANPRAVDTLGTLLANPDDDVQMAAAQSLVKYPGDKANAYLMRAYAGRGPATRAALAKAFGYGPKLQEAVRREAEGIWERNSKALENGGAAEKVGAAEEVGRSGKPEAVDRLIPLLGNDAILLAAGAARGLGGAGDHKAVAPLLAVLKENYPALREAAAEALGELGDPQALALLSQVAQGPDSAASEAAAALARLPRTPDTDSALCTIATKGISGAGIAAKAMSMRGGCPLAPLLARLKQGQAEARATLVALTALDPGKPEVVPALASLVNDKDSQIQVDAIEALAAVGSPEAAPPLMKIVEAETERLDTAREKWVKDGLPLTYAPGYAGPATPNGEFENKMKSLEDRVRASDAARAASAGQVLHEPKPAKIRELVPDIVGDETSILGVAAAALGQTRSPDAAADLEKLLADPDDSIREGAMVGLAYLGGESLPKIQAAWADLSPEAVGQVSAGLRTLGVSAIPVLVAGLASRSSERGPIALALGNLHADVAVEPLEKLLGSAGDECAAAAVALGQLGMSRSVKPLGELLKDPRAAGRVEAIEALGLIKDPTGKDAIVRELFSDRPESRAAAVHALAALGPAPANELEPLRADYYRDVRRAVEQVLGAATASK